MLNINKIMGAEEDVVRFMKIEFNKRVQRLNNGQAYYEKLTTTDADVEKTLNGFLMIHDEIIKIGNEIERYTGEKLTLEIIENGFKNID